MIAFVVFWVILWFVFQLIHVSSFARNPNDVGDVVQLRQIDRDEAAFIIEELYKSPLPLESAQKPFEFWFTKGSRPHTRYEFWKEPPKALVKWSFDRNGNITSNGDTVRWSTFREGLTQKIDTLRLEGYKHMYVFTAHSSPWAVYRLVAPQTKYSFGESKGSVCAKASMSTGQKIVCNLQNICVKGDGDAYVSAGKKPSTAAAVLTQAPIIKYQSRGTIPTILFYPSGLSQTPQTTNPTTGKPLTVDDIVYQIDQVWSAYAYPMYTIAAGTPLKICATFRGQK